MTYGMCVTCVWLLSVLGSKMSSSDETGRDPMQVRLPIHKTEAGLDSQWGSYGDLWVTSAYSCWEEGQAFIVLGTWAVS